MTYWKGTKWPLRDVVRCLHLLHLLFLFFSAFLLVLLVLALALVLPLAPALSSRDKKTTTKLGNRPTVTEAKAGWRWLLRWRPIRCSARTTLARWSPIRVQETRLRGAAAAPPPPRPRRRSRRSNPHTPPPSTPSDRRKTRTKKTNNNKTPPKLSPNKTAALLTIASVCPNSVTSPTEERKIMSKPAPTQ